MSPLIILLIAMILLFTTVQCKIFHDLPAFVPEVPTAFINALPAGSEDANLRGTHGFSPDVHARLQILVQTHLR